MIKRIHQNLNDGLETGLAWLLIGSGLGLMSGALWVMVLFVK